MPKPSTNSVPINFPATDGYILSGKLYSASNSTEYLLIGSAFGVPHQYYKHIAEYFSQKGINTLIFDYRGIGDSQQGITPIEEMAMSDWGQLDIEGAIKCLKSQSNFSQLSYLGHSAGGQIVGLAPSSNHFDKIIIAASGVGSWDKWPGLYKLGMFLVWKLFFPIAMFFRRKPLFNSYLLGKVPVPRNIVKQWLHWARSKDYLFSPEHQLDLIRYQQFEQPLLAMSVTDDRYAPINAMRGLLQHYPNTKISHLRVSPKDANLKSIGHFGIFKKKQEIVTALWQPMLEFLKSNK